MAHGFVNPNYYPDIVGNACTVGYPANIDSMGFVQGPQGPPGATGPQGVKGDFGGPPGPVGPEGPPGPASLVPGPEGPPGPVGLPGPPQSYVANVYDLLANRPNYDNAPRGFTFVTIDDDEDIGGGLYFKLTDATGDWSTTPWYYMDGPTGPQGPMGPTGPEGPQGEQGTQGIRGEQGFQGPVGADGIQGPRGFTGITGAVGQQGIQGLKGDKGDKGDTGNTGATGAQGPTYEDVVSMPAATGTIILDLSSNKAYDIVLAGNINITFSGVAGASRTFPAVVQIRQNGTTPYTVTWPGSCRKNRGIAIVQSTTLNAIDVYTVFTMNGGIWFILSQIGQAFA